MSRDYTSEGSLWERVLEWIPFLGTYRLRKDNARVRTKNDDLEQNVASLDHRVIRCKRQIKDLQKGKEDLQASRREQEEEYEALREDYFGLKRENEDLVLQVEQRVSYLQEDLNHLQGDLNLARDKLKRQNSTIAKHRKEEPHHQRRMVLENLIMQADFPIIILDENFKISEVYPAAASYLNASQEQLLKQAFTDVFEGPSIAYFVEKCELVTRTKHQGYCPQITYHGKTITALVVPELAEERQCVTGCGILLSNGALLKKMANVLHLGNMLRSNNRPIKAREVLERSFREKIENGLIAALNNATYLHVNLANTVEIYPDMQEYLGRLSWAARELPQEQSFCLINVSDRIYVQLRSLERFPVAEQHLRRKEEGASPAYEVVPLPQGS